MNRKLFHYSSAASAFLLIGIPAAEAQIQYHDIDPDIYITGGPWTEYDLDVDSDGVFELKFTFRSDLGIFGGAWSDFGCYGAVLPNYSNCLINYIVESSWSFVLPLAFGDPTVNEGDGIYLNNAPAAFNLQFDNGTSTHGIGPWISDEDMYFGFDYVAAGGGTYANGWVRLQVDVCGYFIKDYATSLDPIFAGEGMPDPCDAPAFVNVVGIGAETAKLIWAPVAGATSYHARYRKVGDPDWHEKVVAAPKTFIKFKSLLCETEFEWQVQAECAGGVSEYTPINTFTTLDCRLGDEEDKAFTVYPNPVSDILHVHFDDAVENASLQLIDITGKIIYTTVANGYSMNLDLADIPAGVYFVCLEINNDVQRVRCIKQ
ncbi:MAG: T9SS type A sorting domain-containing protein [Chitinophagales bacterium]